MYHPSQEPAIDQNMAIYKAQLAEPMSFTVVTYWNPGEG